MTKEIKTWRDLKDFLNGLEESALDQQAIAACLDHPVLHITEAEKTEEDIFYDKSDPEDCGTFKELKEIHGDRFDKNDYIKSFPAGTVFIYTSSTRDE